MGSFNIKSHSNLRFRKYIKIFAVVLCAALILPFLPLKQAADALAASESGETQLLPLPNTPFEKKGEPIEGHYLVCENSGWALYLKPETLSILVKDKKTGEYMSSTVSEPVEKDLPQWKGFYQSGVVLEYIKGTNINNSRADFINTPHEMDIAVVENGFWADVSFTEISISYRLMVTLDDNGVSAQIPQNSIVENDEAYTVGCFYVFPFLGSVYMGEREGYMFIPDGQGALIKLQDNEGRYAYPFSVPVYGYNSGLDEGEYTGGAWFSGFSTINESQDILMPIFGMVHSDSEIAFLGIIEEGDYFAKIEATPNGALTGFDWITAKFIYRQVYTQPTGQVSGGILMRTDRPNRFDIKLKFIFVSGSEANYAGLAVKYREYLVGQGAFASAGDNDFRVQVDFFGSDKKNWTLFKLNVNMTTYSQAADILKTLNEQGVDNILSVYKGWQSGGIYAGLPNKGFNASGSLGGSSGLKKLFEAAEDYNTMLYLQHNPLLVNKDTGFFESMNAIKKVTRRTYDLPWYPGIVYSHGFILTPNRSLEISNTALKSYMKNNVPGIEITDVTSFLTSYYDSEYRDRGDNAAIYSKLTENYADNINTALNSPYEYLWKYADVLTNMPIGGSSYIFTDMEVPFLSIVLSGQIPFYAEYTNFQANQNEFLLQLIEQGAFPSFYVTWEDPFLLQTTNSNTLYSSKFSLYEPRIVDMYTELKAVAEKTANSPIIGHEKTGEMVCVTYENGVKIFLNYGKEKGSINGVEVDGMSYIVTGGGI